MRILLPPSEGKTPADPNCAPIRLDNLVYPRLTDKRLAVGEALQEASGQPDALTVLSVGPRLVDDVVRNCTPVETTRCACPRHLHWCSLRGGCTTHQPRPAARLG